MAEVGNTPLISNVDQPGEGGGPLKLRGGDEARWRPLGVKVAVVVGVEGALVSAAAGEGVYGPPKRDGGGRAAGAEVVGVAWGSSGGTGRMVDMFCVLCRACVLRKRKDRGCLYRKGVGRRSAPRCCDRLVVDDDGSVLGVRVAGRVGVEMMSWWKSTVL